MGYQLHAPAALPPPPQPTRKKPWYTLVEWMDLGVKEAGRGVNHPMPPCTEVKERVQLYLYPPSGPSWPVPG